MRPRRNTTQLTLPDGQKVMVWKRDVEAIRLDVHLTGNVMLRKTEGSEVYERVDPASLEAQSLKPTAKHVG